MAASTAPDKHFASGLEFSGDGGGVAVSMQHPRAFLPSNLSPATWRPLVGGTQVKPPLGPGRQLIFFYWMPAWIPARNLASTVHGQQFMHFVIVDCSIKCSLFSVWFCRMFYLHPANLSLIYLYSLATQV